MSRRKTERLLNLVICLLATRRYLTADQIRDAVPGYADSDEAFKRMFERDKEELRELGIPLEVGNDSPWEDEPGYRIRRSDYELPEISLEPDEAAVLGVAARFWQRASLAEAASGALLKLRAAGIQTDEATPAGIEPRIDTSEPAFPALWEAVRDRRPVGFEYRTAGATEPSRRRLEPWGVVSWRGRWYVAGLDRDREGVRVFRLSRITGDVTPIGGPGSVQVPSDVNVRDIVIARGEPAVERRIARLRVRQGAGDGVRRWAEGTRPDGEGWDIVEFSFREPDWLAGFLVAFGTDVVVLEPADAREAVIWRLKEVAG